jgi:protein-S-isoprenylcysteine O-methyltransferase Ste14
MVHKFVSVQFQTLSNRRELFHSVLFSLAVPVLMPFMMRHLKDLSEPSWQGYLYLVIVVVGAVLAALHFYQAGFYAWTLVAKLRSVLVILTYKKSLRVANVDGSKDTGRIVNMVGTDAQ